MEKFGGKAKSEKAVLAALRWLKNRQNADGSWSDACRPSMTGFALLCFLGHGELAVSPEFGPSVTKAVEWMRTRAVEFDGRMSLTKGEWERDTDVYNHAIATLAMCEYYAMTQDKTFADIVPKAVAYIVDGNGRWAVKNQKQHRSIKRRWRGKFLIHLIHLIHLINQAFNR